MKLFRSSRLHVVLLNGIIAIFFLQFKELELYWGEVLFLINLIGVIFEAGNETREKIWSDLFAEQKWRAEQKESDFLFIPLFLREREIDV